MMNRLDEYVTCSLSEGVPEKDKWQKIPYESSETSGIMLAAGECSFPEKIELRFNQTGWYKIFICLGYLTSVSAVEVSLSDEKGKTIIMPSHTEVYDQNYKWSPIETAEEFFFKSADITGKSIIFNKPHLYSGPNGGKPFSSVILYIRLVEMTKDEIEEYNSCNNKKVIQYHFDEDFIGECDYIEPEDYLGRINMLNHGNGDSLIYETGEDYLSPLKNGKAVPYQKYSQLLDMAYKQYYSKREVVRSLVAERAHKMGIKIYSGFRTGMAAFGTPDISLLKYYGEQALYPNLCCRIRTGEYIPTLSYAYKEARSLMIKKIVDNTPSCFDGVSLFFHRGICVLFEQPVCDRVLSLYGVDARKLPFSDKRLHSVLCEYVTLFMRELKQALKEKSEKERRSPYLISVIIFSDVKSSLVFGQDIETWAREKLIDNFSQGLMRYYEQIETCLTADGMIDLEKYKENKRDHILLRRYYNDDFENLTYGLKEYNEISKKYGIDFYAALPWEHRNAEYFGEAIKKIRNAGSDKFLCWNTNHLAKKASVFDSVKSFVAGGQPEKRRLVRILSFGGRDISEFDTNWKG